MHLKSKINNPESVRFENPKNFHLTVFFLGEVEVNKLGVIYEALKKDLENKSGNLQFNCTEINAFPNLKKPKVLFLNCTNKEDKILKIFQSIKKILSEFGYYADKEFYPHITLGRIKGKAKLDYLSEMKINVNFHVSKLSIMESTITANGALHKEIFGINL